MVISRSARLSAFLAATACLRLYSAHRAAADGYPWRAAQYALVDLSNAAAVFREESDFAQQSVP